MPKESNSIDVVELFGGIGGFSLGLQNASDRFNIVDYIEKDKFAVDSYNQIFDEEYTTTDVKELDAEDIPDCDVITAGYPCQSFSIAGDRGGFDDTRGTLFFDVIRIAKEKQPKILFLENVKGLLSHDDEKTFETIVKTLNETGYYVDFRVLNSKHFGVPQNRNRVFHTGIRFDLIVEDENFEDVVMGFFFEHILEKYENGDIPDFEEALLENIEGIVNPNELSEFFEMENLDVFKPEAQQMSLTSSMGGIDYKASDKAKEIMEEVCNGTHIKDTEYMEAIENREDMKLFMTLKILSEKDIWEEWFNEVISILSEQKVKSNYARRENSKKVKETVSVRDDIYSLATTKEQENPETGFSSGRRPGRGFLPQQGENKGHSPKSQGGGMKTAHQQTENIPQDKRVYLSDGSSPTIDTQSKPKILDNSSDLNLLHPDMWNLGQAERVYEDNGNSPALNGGWTPKVSQQKLNQGIFSELPIPEVDWVKTQRTIINSQMRPEDRPSISEEGQSGGSGILYNDDFVYTLSTSPHFVMEEDVDVKKLGNLYEFQGSKTLYSKLGVSPTLLKGHGGYEPPLVSEDGDSPTRVAERYEGKQAGGVYNPDNIAPTVNFQKRGPMSHYVPEKEVFAELRGDEFRTRMVGISPTLVKKMGTGGNNVPMVKDEEYNLNVTPFGKLPIPDVLWSMVVITEEEGDGELNVIGNTLPSDHESGNVYDPNGVSPTVMERHGKLPKTFQPIDDYNQKFTDIFGAVRQTNSSKAPRNGVKVMEKMVKRVGDYGDGSISIKDISFTLPSNPMSDKKQMLVEPVMTPEFIEKNMNKKSPVGSEDGSMFTVDGTSQHGIAYSPVKLQNSNMKGRRVKNTNEDMFSLQATDRNGLTDWTNGNVRIRKLTPKECWRLQGFPDLSFEKAQEVNSNTQLYKQAGNAVTTTVITAIGRQIAEKL